MESKKHIFSYKLTSKKNFTKAIRTIKVVFLKSSPASSWLSLALGSEMFNPSVEFQVPRLEMPFSVSSITSNEISVRNP